MTGTSTAEHRNIFDDLVLPTVLFAALGGMTWAVRGCSGFGAVKGCVFAGLTWGVAWWFIARDPSGPQSRRYASAWIVLALTVGIGISGARGWMQWPSFFQGELLTNAANGKHEFVPISRAYGFIWLFIAGVPWAGLGACMLAWCGSKRPLTAWEWSLRIACGCGMAYFMGSVLFERFPEVFLPLYSSMKERYLDYGANPNLRRLYGDNQLAIRHLGFYLGFLLFEVGRRDWKNVTLISTVGFVNGLGWALCRNWSWASKVWPDAKFNFWRCWESSGGVSIGIAYGIAYYLVNRRMSDEEMKEQQAPTTSAGPNLPVWAASGLVVLFSAVVTACILNQARGSGSLRMYNLFGTIFGSVFVGIAVLYGILNFVSNQKLSDEARRERRSEGRAGLDWLAVFLSLLTLMALFMIGELNGWYLIAYTVVSVVFAIAYTAVNLPLAAGSAPVVNRDPNLERFGLYAGLILGFGLSIKNGLKGWANIYLGNERYWEGLFRTYTGIAMCVGLVAVAAWILLRPRPRNDRGDVFPHAFGLIWVVLIVQNVIAQLITGPGGWGLALFHVTQRLAPNAGVVPVETLQSNPIEMDFAMYYGVLFVVSAGIIAYFHFRKSRETIVESN